MVFLCEGSLNFQIIHLHLFLIEPYIFFFFFIIVWKNIKFQENKHWFFNLMRYSSVQVTWITQHVNKLCKWHFNWWNNNVFLRVILEGHCNVVEQTECGNWQVSRLLDQDVLDQDIPMSTLGYSITWNG